MRLRLLLAALAILGLMLPCTVASPAPKSMTLGILQTTVLPGSTGAPVALVEALRDLGYHEGRNLVIEFRHGDGANESLPKLAAELVDLKPDVIVAAATPAVIALKKATATIPIVMVAVGNPVEVGLVQSLAHPGANITGRTNTAGAVDINLKRLQIITETLPGICCLTHLVNPSNPANLASLPAVTAAEKSLGIESKWIEAADPDQLDHVLAASFDGRFEKVLVPSADALFWAQRTQIAEAMLRRGMALFGPFREYAEAGALMAYGVDNNDEMRAVAVYVDKILKGAKPADLPIEQPTQFRLVVNLKTAKALGLTIPPAILQRADEVIE